MPYTLYSTKDATLLPVRGVWRQPVVAQPATLPKGGVFARARVVRPRRLPVLARKAVAHVRVRVAVVAVWARPRARLARRHVGAVDKGRHPQRAGPRAVVVVIGHARRRERGPERRRRTRHALRVLRRGAVDPVVATLAGPGLAVRALRRTGPVRERRPRDALDAVFGSRSLVACTANTFIRGV